MIKILSGRILVERLVKSLFAGTLSFRQVRDSGEKRMKLVVAITGASGSLYAQRLLQLIAADPAGPHEVHVALSSHAREVAEAETGKLAIPDAFHVHGDTSMQVPYVSGSTRFDAMVIIPCSMGTVGRIAHGYSDSAIIRAADVFLKERRKLILVPRETPWNLIQARNIVTVLEAGAEVIPRHPILLPPARDRAGCRRHRRGARAGPHRHRPSAGEAVVGEGEERAVKRGIAQFNQAKIPWK